MGSEPFIKIDAVAQQPSNDDMSAVGGLFILNGVGFLNAHGRMDAARRCHRYRLIQSVKSAENQRIKSFLKFIGGDIAVRHEDCVGGVIVRLIELE